jgi:hypothetical protein
MVGVQLFPRAIAIAPSVKVASVEAATAIVASIRFGIIVQVFV